MHEVCIFYSSRRNFARSADNEPDESVEEKW